MKALKANPLGGKKIHGSDFNDTRPDPVRKPPEKRGRLHPRRKEFNPSAGPAPERYPEVSGPRVGAVGQISDALQQEVARRDRKKPFKGIPEP